MNTEWWRRVDEIHQSARELSGVERTRFLEVACGTDGRMRREIEARLEQDETKDRFSRKPAVDLAAERSPVPMPLEAVVPHRAFRRPWWMYLVAVSFLFIHLIEGYLVFWGPIFPEGLDAAFESGTMRVRSVAPATLFARAGLQADDRVLAVGDQPIRSSRDWTAALANVEVERPETWDVLRRGERIELAVSFERATWKNRFDNGVPDYLAVLLSFFLLGLFVGFQRPHDPVARIGAWLFLTMSVAFGLLNGWAAIWRQTPWLVQVLLWIPELSRFALDGIFLSFFAIFPRRLFRTHWLWFVIWIPVLVTIPWRAYGFYSVVYHSGQAITGSDWVNQAIFLRTITYVAAGSLLLLINYRWLADAKDRRRIRVLAGGTAIGLGAAVYTAWNYFSQGYGTQSSDVLSRAVTLLILACPFAFGYAILRHRVLGIQLIIRQGLQYALARGTLLAIVPALTIVLVADLALNRQESLVRIVGERGWAYAGIGCLAMVASFRRKQWLEALDRRFFRERYDSQRVLLDIAREIQEARKFDRAAARVAARVETALHPEFVSVMIHEPTTSEYRSLLSVPAGRACPPIDMNSKLVALVRVLGQPLEVLLADSAWLQSRLPEQEIAFVRRARIDLLVPIATRPGRSEALLVLGIKRSEEPYTSEDQVLLDAIASKLGQLIDQPMSLPEQAATTFAECLQCGLCYEPGTERCEIDGTTLASVRLPRMLARRYWLEQRRGRGGMGTVYAAIDKALERRVAVKVVRDDLLSRDETAQRFHREGRAAAAFAHPNVVTVHDYGVEEGTRAFLVMELLEGRTLRDELHRCKRLAPPRLVEIFRGVCAAVEAAHRRHLIHRDLKPENIFLSRTSDGAGDVVKVLDFGIAKFLPMRDSEAPTRETAETSQGVLMGTRGYMSPEQLAGEDPAVSWDLWALTVIAYETLTGALPFPVQSIADWRVAILAGRFTPLSEHLPDSPDRWQMFFGRSFATDRTARATSAADFCRRLEEAFI